MGIAASCVTNNMNSLIFLSCLSMVLALPHPPPEYPTPAPTQQYNPDIGQTNVGGYGVNKDPYCHMVEKVVFENQCEPYVERTCYTQNKESCVTKPFNNCTGKDRVCDTTYKIDMTTKDDYQCTNVETPNCYMEEKVINDVTCTNSVEFNCKRDKSTKNDGYGPKGVVCSRKPTQNCYNIPRKIQVEVCKTDVHRYCEKFSNIFPFPVEEQNCHFEPKKICELETKTRPKKAKKYSYTKDCKEQPREICDQCEKKSLRPVCEMQERLECAYSPVEKCRDEPKEYCHKVEEVVLEEVCDMKFDTSYL